MSNFILNPNHDNEEIIRNIGRTIRALDPEKRWSVKVGPYRNQRSLEQQGYYRGVVLLTIKNWYYESRGIAVSEDAIHEELKGVYVPYVTEQGMYGEIKLYKSTTKLTTKEFNDMFEKIWADFAQMGCYIPSPDKNYKWSKAA